MAARDRAPRELGAWRPALFAALPVTTFMLALVWFWFGVCDRYQIFLYFHDMEPGFDTTPFGAVTASRYWMSGLVAAGALSVLYTVFCFSAGRVSARFYAPAWWRVWVLCAAPLAAGIPALVMTLNDPTLPLANALQVTAAALSGLAVALLPGEWSARRPAALLLLAPDGLALALLLLTLIHVTSIPAWLARGRAVFVIASGAALAAGLTLLAAVTVLIRWRRLAPPGAPATCAAGLHTAYLLLPLLHHLIGTSDTLTWASPVCCIYISDAANFFAGSLPVQAAVWAAAALLAAGLTRLRSRAAHPPVDLRASSPLP